MLSKGQPGHHTQATPSAAPEGMAHFHETGASEAFSCAALLSLVYNPHCHVSLFSAHQVLRRAHRSLCMCAVATEKETLTKRMYRLLEKASGEQQGAPKKVPTSIQQDGLVSTVLLRGHSQATRCMHMLQEPVNAVAACLSRVSADATPLYFWWQRGAREGARHTRPSRRQTLPGTSSATARCAACRPWLRQLSQACAAGRCLCAEGLYNYQRCRTDAVHAILRLQQHRMPPAVHRACS